MRFYKPNVLFYCEQILQDLLLLAALGLDELVLYLVEPLVDGQIFGYLFYFAIRYFGQFLTLDRCERVTSLYIITIKPDKILHLYFIILWMIIIKQIMQQIFPKVNQVFAYHLNKFDVIDLLMSSVSLRVEAEEQYEKAISKSLAKINQIQTNHPLYSKIIKCFRGLISERVHQIRFFKAQISKEADVLMDALKPIQEEMKSHLSELKGLEKQLRSSYDGLIKSRSSIDIKYKELDEKFVLNQVSIMYKMNKGLRKQSELILKQQQQIQKSLQIESNHFKQNLRKFQTNALDRQHKIWQLDIKIQEYFVDFFKKSNVHEISLIRNIQYDIDNMIKKTDIFNYQNTSQFKQNFNFKASNQLSFHYTDNYISFKKNVISQIEITPNKLEEPPNQDRLNLIKDKFKVKKDAEELFILIKDHYAMYKYQLYEYIISFRKNNQFKMELQTFKLNLFIIREAFRLAYSQSDFQGLQLIITYSNSYYCPSEGKHKKRTILDELKLEKVFSQASFWKFYLLFSIRMAVTNAQGHQQEKQIHIRNGIYSVFLSNSLIMVECGLQKHQVKNLIGKLAKTFALIPQAQISQLLKVIDSTYQNLQKAKTLKSTKN